MTVASGTSMPTASNRVGFVRAISAALCFEIILSLVDSSRHWQLQDMFRDMGVL